MFLFGAGKTFAIPLTDMAGNAIANPTPVRLAVQQSMSLDIDFDVKQLHGNNSFAVDVARGKGNMKGKISAPTINGNTWNGLFFGQTMTKGTMMALSDDVITTIAATVTVTPPSAGTFIEDMGVTDANGVPMVRVASGPVTGQYSVAGAVYTFAAADVGKTCYINFRYSFASAAANQISMTNTLMGSSPRVKLLMQAKYQGKSVTALLYQVQFAKMPIFSTKLDDYQIPDLEFSAMANAAGQVGEFYASE